MSVVEIRTKQDADNIFRSGYSIVIIDHYGDWCFPCKMVAPQFEELAREFSSQHILFAKCNTELRLFQVSGLPTFEFYVDGQRVEQVVGADIQRVRNLTHTLLQRPTMSSSEMSQLSFASNGIAPQHQQQSQHPIGSLQNTAQPPPNTNPYSTGAYKTGSKGRNGTYSTYKTL